MRLQTLLCGCKRCYAAANVKIEKDEVAIDNNLRVDTKMKIMQMTSVWKH